MQTWRYWTPPSIELFQLLTEGDSFIALDKTQKFEYATRFAAHKASENVLRLDKKGSIVVNRFGSCGTSGICYALFFDIANLWESLVLYDFHEDKKLWEVEDITDACHYCFDPGHFIFWIKKSYLPRGQKALYALDVQTKTSFEIGTVLRLRGTSLDKAFSRHTRSLG